MHTDDNVKKKIKKYYVLLVILCVVFAVFAFWLLLFTEELNNIVEFKYLFVLCTLVLGADVYSLIIIMCRKDDLTLFIEEPRVINVRNNLVISVYINDKFEDVYGVWKIDNKAYDSYSVNLKENTIYLTKDVDVVEK